MHPRLKVVEVNSIEAIDATQWDELWEHCPDATVFQSRQWLQAWLDVFGSTENPPRVLAAIDGSRTVGLAPLVRDPEAGCWKIVGDDYSDYQTFLAWEGSAHILQALLATAHKCLPAGDSILLNDIPQFSALARLLTSAPSGRSLSLDGVVAGAYVACPSLCIRTNPLGVARVLAKRSLRRHERALAKHGELSVEHIENPEQITPLLPGLFTQHIARWEGTGHPSLFLNPKNQHFYQAFTSRAGRSALLFTVLRAGERVAAQHFGLRSRNSLLWYKPAFDVALREVSPGEVLLSTLVEHAASNSLDELDFTRGDEPFKSRFASNIAYNRHFAWHRKLRSRLWARGKFALRDLRDAARPVAEAGARSLGGAASAPNTGTRAVVLDAEGNEEAAGHVEKSLESCGVEVHRATAEGLLAIVDHDYYTLIVPCSRAALDVLAALPYSDPRRVRALLPSRAALSSVHSIDGTNVAGGNHSSVLCVYVHGKLSLCFPDNSELVGPTKRMLDAVQWHGLARVSVERGHEGSLRLVAVSAALDETVLGAGVNLPRALWRIARGEPVGHP